MKIFSLKLIGILFVASTILSSCVTSKKYKELQSKRDLSEKENSQLKDENRDLTTRNTEYSAKVARYNQQIKSLLQDTTDLGKKLRTLSTYHKSLNKNYEDLLAQNQALISGNQIETKKILAQLQQSQADLIKREDSLSMLEKEYTNRKKELDLLSQQFAAMNSNLLEKEAAYDALNNEVQRKDSLMKALKNSVANALKGFENDGLTVSNRGGRVYVSMDNKLMFASGSFNLNPKGKSALVKLAAVLQDNPDINILVEGHTDSVPYSGSGNLQDNWDLSAKRATSIVRILVENSTISPIKITAAGRGEYNPVESNTTPEGRAKNRRTEIILMPNLSELYQIVNE